MKNLKKIALIALFFAFNHSLQAQFKFGWGLLGYTGGIGNKFRADLPSDGLNGYFEFASLVENHFEPGLRIGGIMLFDTLNGIMQAYTMPYLRYYFMDSIDMRPYIVGGTGWAFTVGFPSLVLGISPTAKIGSGIKLTRHVDVSAYYLYAGQIFSLSNIYQMHSLEFSFALTFGGNFDINKKCWHQ
jgi:hypothetical protein